MGRGGLQNGKGACEDLPLQNGWGGGGKGFSHAEGGVQKKFGVVFKWQLEVLVILKGGRKKFPALKGKMRKFHPVLKGCAKSFGPAIFPFCSPPPLPVINDQSLIHYTDISVGMGMNAIFQLI